MGQHVSRTRNYGVKKWNSFAKFESRKEKNDFYFSIDFLGHKWKDISIKVGVGNPSHTTFRCHANGSSNLRSDVLPSTCGYCRCIVCTTLNELFVIWNELFKGFDEEELQCSEALQRIRKLHI
jgi:hypothetical protein